LFVINTGYFTSDNELGGIENATHNTLENKPGYGGENNPPGVLWVAFSIPPGSLSLLYIRKGNMLKCQILLYPCLNHFVLGWIDKYCHLR
jgi:hypothetical protein